MSDGVGAGPYEVDWTGRWTGRALAVERPGSAAEVAAVLRRCAAERLPVVVAGGRTGLVGGAVPPPGGAVVLSTERLTALGPVEPDGAGGGTVVAQAGVPLAAVQRAAAAAGLEYGVDLAARDAATVGGTVATDAGGVHVVAHGTTGAQVVGLEAVLADGTVLARLDPAPKEALGPDWARLLVGSEGVLAVVTAARLRLRPRPEHRAVARVPLPGGAAGVAAALGLLPLVRALPALRAVEWAEAPVVDRTHLLVEVGAPAEALAPLDAAAPGLEVADDPAGRARLWAAREGCSERVAGLATARGAPVHKLDVAVPVPRLAALRAALPEGALVWGHLAEGNLHVNGWDPPGGPADAFDDAVLAAVARLGGAVSSEHGVGRAKAAALALSRSPAELALLRRLKAALDPDGLLGPGVLLA